MFYPSRVAVHGWCSLVLLAGVLTLPAGCSLKGPKPIEPAPTSVTAQEEATGQPFSLEPFLRASRLGLWNYVRTASGETDSHATIYTRWSGPTQLIEGKLLGREFLPLETYLQRRDIESPQTQRRPKAPLEGGTAFMFELIEPMEPLPPDLQPGLPQTASTPIVYYEYDGRLLSQGTLTRTAEIEGFEDVETPAGRFDGCLRTRVDLVVRLSWIFEMNWTSYLWLSAEMGEVQRTEQMSGRFLIFPFASSHDYRLVSGKPILHWAEPESVLPPRWRFGAVVMDRTVPSPRIGGMVVDYSDLPPATQPATQPASQPATQPAQTVWGAGILPAWK
ncbi:MAG TPA: hypothetical protein PL151_13615 [Phycisphaerae bacterium]|nr:hypothetical protein [Phycisphaerae bacterium]HOJ73622.1 hypothetical protein [Phycisphaerae bacterium]HOM51569.1 hypothetical protein [Phycisphaerae bacterium]HON67148.1 hypothetical protein [Phycisphaerae bacterium]HOQ87401.1 hypothetical protein [Phycisphaerae bacterium]